MERSGRKLDTNGGGRKKYWVRVINLGVTHIRTVMKAMVVDEVFWGNYRGRKAEM